VVMWQHNFGARAHTHTHIKCYTATSPHLTFYTFLTYFKIQ